MDATEVPLVVTKPSRFKRALVLSTAALAVAAVAKVVVTRLGSDDAETPVTPVA